MPWGGVQGDLLEILDDRYQTRATAIASQVRGEHWHEWFPDATVADAVLRRIGLP
jgi:hypothetical protein